MKNLKRHIVITVVTTSVITSTTAVAFDLGGLSSLLNGIGGANNALGGLAERLGLQELAEASSTLSPFFGNAQDLLQDISYYTSQMRLFYSAIVGGNLWGIVNGLETVVGVLGIPDPDLAASEAEVTDATNGLPPAPYMGKKAVINRQISHGITATTLSQAGQGQLDALQKQADLLTQQAWANAQSASSKNVTQDVLKEQAKIQATSAQLERLQSAQLQNLQLGQAAGNLSLENLDISVESLNYARIQEENRQATLMEATNSLLYVPGLPTALGYRN